jgi:hypothetical protein
MDSLSCKGRKFRPFLRLLTWWKRRRFQYLVQVDTQEDYVIKDPITQKMTDTKSIQESIPYRNSQQIPSTSTFVPPSERYFHANTSATVPKFYSFERGTTIGSLQDSLESMDSVKDSQWDPEDEISQATELATNVRRQDEFLYEHLNFLNVQTQPQEIVLVYNS